MPLFERDWEQVGSLQLDTEYGQHILWLAELGAGMENRGTYLTTNQNSTALARLDTSWQFLDGDEE